MPKTTEFRQSDITSWLSADLGQTMPQFTTAGSAGYGTSYKPYFAVRGSESVNVGGPINRRSDDFRENTKALQGIGRVTGVSYVGVHGQSLAGLAALDGIFDDALAATKRAWGATANAAGAAFDKAKSLYNDAVSYVTDPKRFINDLARNVPGASMIIDRIVKNLKESQDNLYRLYNLTQSLRAMGNKSPVDEKTLQEWDNGRNKSVGDWVSSCYVMYSIPEAAKKMAAAGVRKPDINEAWILKSVQASTISNKLYNTIKEQNKTGALDGLGEPITTTAIIVIAVASVAVISALAYTINQVCEMAVTKARAESDKALIDAMQAQKLPWSEIQKALDKKHADELKSDKERAKSNIFANLGSWLPWAVGGVVVIALLPTLTALGKRGAGVVGPVNGLRRRGW